MDRASDGKRWKRKSWGEDGDGCRRLIDGMRVRGLNDVIGGESGARAHRRRAGVGRGSREREGAILGKWSRWVDGASTGGKRDTCG